MRTLILGAGGHARVLIDCLLSLKGERPEGILDPDRSLWGKEILGIPVLGPDSLLPELVKKGATHFVVGLGGVGDNRPRAQLFELGLRHGLQPLTVTHPSAVCSPSAFAGPGSVLYPCSVVNAGAVLGMNVIVNTGALIEHDCRVGDHVHVATGARLGGAVQIGRYAHIGAGATVRQSISIGEGAIVGAGAVVVKDVEPSTVVVGVPARLLERQEAE